MVAVNEGREFDVAILAIEVMEPDRTDEPVAAELADSEVVAVAAFRVTVALLEPALRRSAPCSPPDLRSADR